jgi:hypothetical protein
MMRNLKAKYQEIEEDLTWPEIPNIPGKGDQFYQLVKILRAAVKERSLDENLDPSLYNDRLYSLLDLIIDLRSALNYYIDQPPEEKKNEQHVWHHFNDSHIEKFVRKDNEPQIYRELLLDTAVKYLKNSWLQNDQIDWIFIDSLIFAEISAYSKSVLSGEALGKPNIAYLLADGDTNKILKYHLIKSISLILFRYILPIATIFLFYHVERHVIFPIALAAYSLYLIQHIIFWPIRFFKRKKMRKSMQEHMDRLQKMINTYYYCRPPIISIATLYSYLNKAVEAGAIFDGALFSILQRIEKTKGDAFMPFTDSL